MGGYIDMSLNKIINLPPLFLNASPATKKYSDDKFAEKADVLSDTGFTMKGGINMSTNKITNLPTPTTNSEPATKKYSDDKFVEKADVLSDTGFAMKGNIDMTLNKIINLPPPTADGEPATKKYSDDKFAQIPDTISDLGFNMQGDIDMVMNKIINLPIPTSDAEPTTKKYVYDKYTQKSGFSMQGTIDMYDNKIVNLPIPKLFNEPAIKGYVDRLFVLKSKIITADWSWAYHNTGSLYKYPYRDSGWPAPVRTDELSPQTNIVLRHITFDNELTTAQILACTLIVSFRYHLASKHKEAEIFNLPLTGKTILTIPTDSNTNTYTLPLEEEFWLGTLAIDNVHNPALAFTVKIRITGVPSNKDPEVICSFRLNESGQYG